MHIIFSVAFAAAAGCIEESARTVAGAAVERGMPAQQGKRDQVVIKAYRCIPRRFVVAAFTTVAELLLVRIVIDMTLSTGLRQRLRH